MKNLDTESYSIICKFAKIKIVKIKIKQIVFYYSMRKTLIRIIAMFAIKKKQNY